MEVLHLSGLDFEVRRSPRRKTIGITVDRAGELLAHAPSETSIEEISQWVNKKLLWVHRKLAVKEQIAPTIPEPEYVSGETFAYLGRRYRLITINNQAIPLRFDGSQFILRRDAKPAEPHFRRWYAAAGTEWLNRRVAFLSVRAGTKPRGIKVRELGFRWGSCTKQRFILLNWRVLQLPVRLVDYVIIHELIHLREGHHGREFWEALERALPDWRTRKDVLARKAKDYLNFSRGASRR